ncbi:MAG: PEP-CTERM sorting domain-containing protein [Tepidisphaeraceae bacterium]
MSVTDVVAHSGTKSITNTQTFPTGFTNLYQFGVAETTAELKGRTIAWSFWVYYDPNAAGNNAASDNFSYQFDTRNTFNEYNSVQSGNVAASTLTGGTWTKFSGYFRNDPNVVLANGDATLVSAVLNGPTGTFYWDDFASGAVLDGDADLDGDVDFTDFLALQANFGSAATTFVQGNFNYDATTDFNDFLILQANFGKSTTGDTVTVTASDVAAMTAFATTVPEPTTLALAGVGGVMLARRSRKSR